MFSVEDNDRIIFNVAQLIRENMPDIKRCVNIFSNIFQNVWCEVFSRPLMKRHRIIPPDVLPYRTATECHSGNLSPFGCSVEERDRTPLEVLAFFSPFFAGEELLVGKV